MKKYTEINLSLRDKFKLFFFNIIPEEQLPNKEQHSYQEEETQSTEEQQDTGQQNINNNEHNFNIPFFDFDKNDKKSNF